MVDGLNLTKYINETVFTAFVKNGSKSTLI